MYDIFKLQGGHKPPKRKELTAMKNYSVYEIESILKANNWKETKITCPDGFVVAVTPCSYADKITKASDCAYFLIDGDMPFMGGDNLFDVRNTINNHAEDLKRLNEDREELKKYFEAHKGHWNDDTWSAYSDSHKSMFGFRPHGEVFGVYVEPYPGAMVGA